jgi:hypothetical protein
MSKEYELKNFEYPMKYELDKDSKYFREPLPEPMFQQIYEKIKLAAIGALSQADPKFADLYKSILPDADRYLDPQFIDVLRDFFVGCQDINSPMAQVIIRNLTGKLCTYLRFQKEREMYKEELDKIQIKKPIFIQSLPRSGSTYLHTLMASDPKASAIRLYEYIAAGSKTMTKENRIAMIQAVLNQIHKENDELDSVHNMDSPLNFEEEVFFIEMLGQCYLVANALPRLEQLRVGQCKRDFHYIYEALVDCFKMHMIEYPLKQDGYLCLKAVCHFASPVPFFDVFGTKEIDARIIWIHREPVEQIKSLIPFCILATSRFESDIGIKDIEWINKNAIKYNEIMLRNAIAVRDAWIAADPERKKQIYDVSFKDAVTKPKETVKKIYEYFGMEFDEEVEKCLQKTIEEGDPQRKHGRKKHDQNLYFFKPEDVRKQFMFYYERFKDYLPDYFVDKA